MRPVRQALHRVQVCSRQRSTRGRQLTAQKLARMFAENFKTNFADAEATVVAAGPIV